MSITVDKVELEIAVKHDKTRQEINKITDDINEETRALKTLQKEKQQAMKKYKDESHPEVVKLTLAYADQEKKIAALNRKKDALRQTLGVEGLSIRELRDELKRYNMMVVNLTPGTEKFNETKQHVDELKKRIKELTDEAGRAKNALNAKSGGGWLEKISQIASISFYAEKAASKLMEVADEAVELARQAEGIEMAFRRIDSPGLLDNLREATHGTVDDLELMRQAVQFKDFNLDVQTLGNFLAFAQQKAKDTGQSIDYLVNSIVTGLGRQSKQILDNLGISAAEITEEMKNGGDMVQAVSRIVERNMQAVGDYTETAADRAARATARQRNAMLELGRQIMPIREAVTDVFNAILYGATKTISLLVEHRKAILVLTTALTAYIVAVKAHAIAEGLRAAKTWLAEKAQLALNAAQKASPVGLLTAGVTALVTALIAYAGKANKATEAQQRLNDAQKTAEDQYIEEKFRIEQLSNAVHDNSRSLDERRKALEELKAIVPGYHAELSEEGRLYKDNATAIDNYLKQLKMSLLTKAYEEQLVEAYKKRAEAERAYNEAFDNRQGGVYRSAENVWLNKLWADYEAAADVVDKLEEVVDKHQAAARSIAAFQKALHKTADDTGTTGDATKDTLPWWQDELKRRKDALDALRADAQAAAADIEEAQKLVKEAEDKVKVFSPSSPAGKKTDSHGKEKDAELKKQAEATLKAAYQHELVTLKQARQQQLMTEEDYQQRRYLAEQTYLRDLASLREEFGASQAERQDVQNQQLDALLAEQQRQQQQRQQQMNDALATAEISYRTDQAALEQRYWQGDIASEQDFLQQKQQAETDYLKQRIALIRQYGGDATQAEDALQQAELQKLKSGAERRQKELEQQMTRQPAMRTSQKLKLVDENAEVLGWKRAQEMKTQILEDEEKKRAEISQTAYSSLNSLMQSTSSLFSALQSRETAKVDAKYKKLLAAAKKQGRDTAKLEEQQEAEKMEIQKKYAQKQFKLQILEIVAATAQSIANVWKQWAAYPPVAAALSAVAAAQGAIQLATAKAQADQAAGLYSGGFSDDYRRRSFVEGYTATGNPREQAGVIPVHRNEFVANHHTVANPQLRPLLDTIDLHQRRGDIQVINATRLLAEAYGRGLYAGGYSLAPAAIAAADGAVIPAQAAGQEIVDLLRQIRRNTAESLTVRTLRKEIAHQERLEQNAAR